ncbi:hypothetical protein G6F60_015575 [Rhizopus arrhizus]|nr:hypothetical protein G6F60_015575 [Rhizopus arrhizus]
MPPAAKFSASVTFATPHIDVASETLKRLERCFWAIYASTVQPLLRCRRTLGLLAGQPSVRSKFRITALSTPGSLAPQWSSDQTGSSTAFPMPLLITRIRA